MDIAASEFAKQKDGQTVYDLDFKNENSDPSKWVHTYFCSFWPKFFAFVFEPMSQWANVLKSKLPSGLIGTEIK